MNGYPCRVEQDATYRMTGGTHGAAIQAHTIRGGIHVHVDTGKEAAVPTVAPPPPSGWDEVTALPPDVRSLLRAQILAAKDLPYRLPGARQPSLETVYVRQDLGSGIEEPAFEQQRPTPILDSRGQLVDAPTGPVVRVAVRPPARTVREALDDDHYLLITGGPGQGKSTLSLRLAATVAEQWLSPKPDTDTAPLAEPVLPLRLPARELAAHLDLPFPEALATSAATEYNRLLSTPPTAQALQERVAGCRWLLLVDGLDEIADGTDRDRLVTALTGWAAQDGSPYRFVLTTRPIEGAALAPLQRIGAARYELQPFDDKALSRFADHWFDDLDLSYRFVRQIRAAHLDELVRVPLLATIAAIVFEQHDTRPLPDNQYELYESYLRYLRTAHQIAPCPFDQIHDPLLEHLGRVRLDHDTSLVAAAREWVTQRIPNLTGHWQDELVTYLTVVGPLTWRGDDLRFLHHSFAEHLAATAEARLLPERFDPGHPDFARLLHAARPKERGQHARAVLLHYTRLRAPEADRLIAWLHAADAEQHLLAARLLASHTPAGAPVVDAFLATVRAWAMTTQHLADDILEQTSRATHHPGIAEWLADLMREEKAPWESRIEAATALSTRLRGPDTTEAITLLRTVVDDVAIPVEHRLAAAEALSECGAEEREASERGLRSVLADPDATGWNCRTAAVVLASFGGTARAHAVETLSDLLDDPWMPDSDLADIASGLVEIGVEFHERCAEVFHAILNRRTIASNGLRDAAIGLAALGPQHLINVVTTLTSIITDRSLHRNVRLRTAAVLAELGPQHRLAAGRHVLDIATEFDVEPGDRWSIAQRLTKVGFHDHAVSLLRTALDSHGLSPNARLWTARELADIGPDHHDAAVPEFHRVANDPRSGEYEHAGALAALAALGEPHRTPAVASLRSDLADDGADPASRCAAGRELIRLGPEFHYEVVEQVLEIASYHANPGTRAMAWHIMLDLDIDLRLRAAAELRELAHPGALAWWESHREPWMPTRSWSADDPESTAAALVAVLREPVASENTKRQATSALIQLGRRFHRLALDGMIALLHHHNAPSRQLFMFGMDASDFGAAPRAELIEALCGVTRQPFTTPNALCDVADSLARLDGYPPPEIIAALRAITSDNTADPDSRATAAVALARAEPEKLADVAAIVLRSHGKWIYLWDRRVRKLAVLGADVVPYLRVLTVDRDARCGWRAASAATLAQLCPGKHEEALVLLRNQSDDEFLEFAWRTDAILHRDRFDASAQTDAVAYHLSVLNDERQPVRDRCEAAYQLVVLDESLAHAAMKSLRQFATNTRFTVEEQWAGIYQLSRLCNSESNTEINQLGLAAARNPAATPFVRSQLCRLMSGRPRLEVERSLLADRTASPSQRVGELNMWEHKSLGEQAEMVLRDVLAAADSTPGERVEAAAALGNLAPGFIPEAMRLLKELATGRCAVRDARVKLAELSLTERHRIVTEAERAVSDVTCPRRERREAAALICDLVSRPSELVIEYLRQLADDPGTGEAERIRILYLLRTEDGLGRLREIRDDESTSSAIRRGVANWLRNFDVTDRAAGARVLNAIARDTACRPALRWRAARDLTSFGERGRELGGRSLRMITLDEALPTTVRIDAAEALGNVRPDQRADILRLLRKLQAAENPRTRIRALRAIGQFDPADAAFMLSELAADNTLTAGVRLRAAVAMAELRNDYREKAAVTAKNIAYDEAAPQHIRIKAARCLARWSEPFRTQAQTLLLELTHAQVD